MNSIKGSFHHSSQRQGYTLLEIMIAVTIIGVLAALAAPSFRKSTDTTKSNVVVNDLRVFSDAFKQYNLETNAWPVTAAATVPQGMDDFLKESSWLEPHAFGGSYQWLAPASLDDGSNVSALISVVPGNMTRAQATNIDKKMDDGNLATGNFRIAIRGQPILILAQ